MGWRSILVLTRGGCCEIASCAGFGEGVAQIFDVVLETGLTGSKDHCPGEQGREDQSNTAAPETLLERLSTADPESGDANSEL